MKDRINFWLNQRNFREKLYLFIISLLLGIFLALFLAKGLEINEDLRSEELISFENDFTQDENLKELDINLQRFQKSEKEYLDEIYKLANKEKIIFENIKSESFSTAHFKHYTLKLEFFTHFHQLLLFLQSVQNSNFIFELSNLSLNMEKNQLKAVLSIKFSSLI
ncbi:hypothetical protein DMB92_01670 [Campylobacter sp. MIT 99-7217]|uniref:hypothetical protein n=1 Tax=Campylobacter sp. MIT 99-7217 TaxID=535091 RepID=UPI001157605D|nr:hypothetical protein [Campylobacter sp. MIT 99-7217]TQR34694.1 hypothetical protein DMB92_01670 [Campylobacter sp. MIT 99-7217]